MNAESLRQFYKPEQVSVLFVGESPPVGGTFFYRANSKLFWYTREAFLDTGFDSTNEESFLRLFQQLGCYLDDLCLIPINGLSKQERRRQRTAGIVPLASRIRTESPKVVISVMAAIRPHLQRAMEQAGQDHVPLHVLPFPSHGHQGRYVDQLTGLLHDLKQANILSGLTG